MSPSIAADLVGAALLSTLIFPLLGLRMRRDRASHVTAMTATWRKTADPAYAAAERVVSSANR